MQPSPDPNSASASARINALSSAARATFLEAFVRELARDFPYGGAQPADPCDCARAESFDPSADGGRPANRMAGLS